MEEEEVPIRSIAERLARKLEPEEWTDVFARLNGEEREILKGHWGFWERDDQKPPGGRWRVWLILAGRGAGKTRTGAEWARGKAERNGLTRIALVGATMAEARAVMVEGESGLLNIGPPRDRPLWEPSLGRLTWRSGAKGFVYSAENPEALRGPQHHYAWCDELGKWQQGVDVWDNLLLGLRMGALPKVVATTTPRPGPLIRRLLTEPGVVVRHGKSHENDQLPAAFLEAIDAIHAGTRFGRQEIDGELIEDVEGALWSRALIEACRARALPDLARVVIGVDPAGDSKGDACGIVAVGLGEDGRAYVIEDASLEKAAPDDWARAVAGCAARHDADRVIAEGNYGGAMVSSVLRAADATLPVKIVHARRGKSARAEPVMALYGAGRAFHAGAFPALEDQMCGMLTGGGYQGPGRSPDRADALVWAMTELMLGKTGAARVRVA